MKALVFLLLTVFAWGIEVREEEIMKNLQKLKERGVLSEERMKEIERYREGLEGINEKVMKRAEEYREGVAGEGKERKELDKVVYIFISSSVPLEVWWNYAHYLLDKGIRGVFVLRGCIGGCRYIRPTLEFIRRFLTEDGKNEKGLEVEVQIDPLKFREYGVSVVPCVALEGKKVLSCGDWNMEYHLKRLGAYGEG